MINEDLHYKTWKSEPLKFSHLDSILISVSPTLQTQISESFRLYTKNSFNM